MTVSGLTISSVLFHPSYRSVSIRPKKSLSKCPNRGLDEVRLIQRPLHPLERGPSDPDARCQTVLGIDHPRQGMDNHGGAPAGMRQKCTWTARKRCAGFGARTGPDLPEIHGSVNRLATVCPCHITQPSGRTPYVTGRRKERRVPDMSALRQRPEESLVPQSSRASWKAVCVLLSRMQEGPWRVSPEGSLDGIGRTTPRGATLRVVPVRS